MDFLMRIALMFPVAAIVFLSVTSTAAFALDPTSCRLEARESHDIGDARYTRSLVGMSEITRAREADTPEVEIKRAWDVAKIIAGFEPLTVSGFVDVIVSLSRIGAISPDAGREFMRGLLAEIDPIANQVSEMDVRPMRAYLKARYQLDVEDEIEQYKSFDVLDRRIRAARLCKERRFFLLLELAEQIGARHGARAARPRLEELGRRAGTLDGVGLTGIPMKWYGYDRLTVAAAGFGLIDHADAWLSVTQREAEHVTGSAFTSMVSRKFVETAMEDLPEYVADRRKHHLARE